jgi:hypothetical protein
VLFVSVQSRCYDLHCSELVLESFSAVVPDLGHFIKFTYPSDHVAHELGA